MNNLSGKARLVFILLWCVVIANILWFLFRWSDDTVYEGPAEPDGGYTDIISRDTTEDDETLADEDEEESEDEEKEDHAEAVQNEDFYYSQLTAREQAAYDVLLEGVLACEEMIPVDDCSADEAENAWLAMLMDHVEIFWAHSYHSLTYTSPEERVEVTPDYIYSADEVKDRQNQIEAVVDDCLDGISGGASDYEKIKYVYEYIVDETEYDTYADNNQYIDSVLIGKSSVCAGYARSTKYLLNQMGINCYYVTGDTVGDTAGVGHAWNIVECEGEYYYVDSTWGDPLYQSDTKEVNEEKVWYDDISNTSYDFLCCNDDMLFVTHTLESDLGYEYPSCTSLDWNYYVVNERYIETYEPDAIDEMIREDIENENEVSEFKFANQDIYNEAYENMTKQHWQTGVQAINESKGITNAECVYRYNPERCTFFIYWYYGN